MRVAAIVVIGLAMVASSSQAAGGPTTRTIVVPAQVVFKNGNRPGDRGNCAVVAFGQWLHEPGTTAVTVGYRYKGRDQSVSGKPPFDDRLDYVARFRVPAGSHWLRISGSHADGPVANDCSSKIPIYKERYDVNAVAELTLSESPDCKDAKKYLARWTNKVSSLQRGLNEATGVSSRALFDFAISQAKNERTLWAARVKKLC